MWGGQLPEYAEAPNLWNKHFGHLKGAALAIAGGPSRLLANPSDTRSSSWHCSICKLQLLACMHLRTLGPYFHQKRKCHVCNRLCFDVRDSLQIVKETLHGASGLSDLVESGAPACSTCLEPVCELSEGRTGIQAAVGKLPGRLAPGPWNCYPGVEEQDRDKGNWQWQGRLLSS